PYTTLFRSKGARGRQSSEKGNQAGHAADRHLSAKRPRPSFGRLNPGLGTYGGAHGRDRRFEPREVTVRSGTAGGVEHGHDPVQPGVRVAHRYVPLREELGGPRIEGKTSHLSQVIVSVGPGVTLPNRNFSYLRRGGRGRRAPGAGGPGRRSDASPRFVPRRRRSGRRPRGG